MIEGFNFRQTLAYVTDPVDTQFVNPSALYPTTANGATFGWSSAITVSRNRSTTVDPRLAGHHAWGNVSAANDFTVDLPSAGSYDITLALGDASFAAGCGIQIYDSDGTTLLHSLAVVSVPAGSAMDAIGNIYTDATFFASQTKKRLTFSGTKAIFRFGGLTTSSGSTTVQHINVESVATGGTTYNDTLTETVTAAQTNSNAATFGNSLTETATASATVTAAQTFAAALAEGISAADGETSAATWPNALNEALAANYSVTGSLGAQTYNDTLTEALTAAFVLTAGLVIDAALSEAATAADSQAVQVAFGATLDETIAANDNEEALGAFGHALTETVTLVDDFVGAKLGGRVATTSVHLGGYARRPAQVSTGRRPASLSTGRR